MLTDWRRGVLKPVVCALALGALVIGPCVARADRYVRPDGDDSGDCSSPSAPCATIAFAVGLAASGESVRLAQGTYAGDVTFSASSSNLTIEGGWSRDFAWVDPDPAATVIDGGGITCNGWGHPSLRLERLTIRNAAVAVQVSAECSTSLDAVVLRGNQTALSGGGGPDVSVTVTNSQAVENGTGLHLGALGQDVHVTLAMTSSTLSGNGVGLDLTAGGMPSWFVTFTAHVTGSIVHGNSTADVQLTKSDFATCSLVASYSDFGVVANAGWTFTPGAGMIDDDPAFVGPGDYHLTVGSACVDAGTNAGAPTHDYDAEPRPFDGDGDGSADADMGADEYWPFPAGPLLFWDDLESGDASRWSAAQP